MAAPRSRHFGAIPITIGHRSPIPIRSLQYIGVLVMGAPVTGVARDALQLRTVASARSPEGSYASSDRLTRPRPASIRAAAARAAAAPYANVSHGPTALQSTPPMVLAANAARPVAV